MRQEAHDEHALRVAADLDVREQPGRPTVGELAVGQFFIVREAEPLRACALALLHRGAHFAGVTRERIGIHPGIGHHEAQPRIHGVLVGDAMRFAAERHDHAAEAVGVEIVLAEVAHHRLRLRMDVRQVVGLVERIDADLPVRAPHGAHMAHGVHLVDTVVLEVSLRQSDPLREGLGLAVEVDEHQTGVGVASHLGEPRSMGDQ